MAIFFDKFENKEELILRDHLALERTRLRMNKLFFPICVHPCIFLRLELGYMKLRVLEN